MARNVRRLEETQPRRRGPVAVVPSRVHDGPRAGAARPAPRLRVHARSEVHEGEDRARGREDVARLGLSYRCPNIW